MGFLDQLKQLNELKSKMEETKKRLEGVEVSEENSCVTVRVNGNRKITSIAIKEPLNSSHETLLVEAMNKALAKADNIMQSEMMGAMPKIPGLG